VVMSTPNHESGESSTVLPAQQARQGAVGNNVRYVLGFGLAAIVIALGIIYFIYFA
jgi:heme/copper-type cytochrome/quinol oxidase subunit 4